MKLYRPTTQPPPTLHWFVFSWFLEFFLLVNIFWMLLLNVTLPNPVYLLDQIIIIETLLLLLLLGIYHVYRQVFQIHVPNVYILISGSLFIVIYFLLFTHASNSLAFFATRSRSQNIQAPCLTETWEVCRLFVYLSWYHILYRNTVLHASDVWKILKC